MKLTNFIVALLALTCGEVGAQDTAANKDVLGRWVKAIWQDHDRSYIKNNATGDYPVEGNEAWFDSITTTYPDARVEILHMLAEGDEVALHWEFTGTSSLKGTEGRSIKVPGLSIVKIENGKIASDVFAYNDLDGHRQLGFTLRAPEEDKVRKVVLDLHAGLKNKTHDNTKIHDETYLRVWNNPVTGEWSSNFSDKMHTTPWRADESIDYGSNVEFIDTKVQGDNAIVQVRETGHYRNTETGDGNAWTDVPNIWLLHKNTSDNWKIVGALLGVGSKVEATNYDDGS
mgnify:FL=1